MTCQPFQLFRLTRMTTYYQQNIPQKKKNQPFEHAHETDIGRIYAFYVNYIVGQVD